MHVTFAIAVMLMFVVMVKCIGPGAPGCVQCGKRIRHAPDCPSQRKGL